MSWIAFINRTVKALIPLKEGRQGLIKLHVPLVVGVGVPVCSKKGILFEAEKCVHRECGCVGVGACKNPMELSMCDSPIETFEYIWCILGGCLSQNCRNTLPLHNS